MRADMSWFSVLAHHAIRTPDKPVTVFEGDTVTYGQMARRCGELAAGLHQRGVGMGDVVGLLAYNCTEILETIFAANYLGAIAMPINWRLAPPELRYILEHSEARALVADRALVELANAATRDMEAGLLRICISAPAPDGWTVLAELREESNIPPPAIAAGDDVHRLMYTSGTTGRPKGVMITHANLAWKNMAHIVEFGFTGSDLGLACGPLYHVGALDLTTTSLIAAGATTIIHRTFDAPAVIDEIERSGVTTVWLAPAMVKDIMALPDIDQRDLSSLRLVINGGEKMPIPLIERLQRTFPSAWFADAYGLTETVSGDTFLDRQSIVSKVGSVGRPCLFVELDIWDEQGKSLPAGERGEVVLRGPKVFKGYLRDPDATAKAFAGGWFHTGDIGVRDEDGYLFIVDRLKDLILSGGENIAGSEVERVLYEHDAVLEVAVVGRPDERWGEVPVAFVSLRPTAIATAEELIQHCRGQLARFKVPKDIVFVDSLPRNPSGKVLKRELRDRERVARVRLAPLPFEQWSESARTVLPRYLRRPELYLSGANPMPQALGLLAHHVELGAAWLAFAELLAGDGATLDARLRELAILRVAWRTASNYEWLQHARIGRNAGVTTEQLYAIPEGPGAALWTPLERHVLEAVDQVVGNQRIDARTYGALAEDLDAPQLLELSFVIGSYLCFATVTNSVGLEADPPTEPVDAPQLPVI
jgi:acyl-CoA synthetase (AMP-forming)/AMP-acid ligase II